MVTIPPELKTEYPFESHFMSINENKLHYVDVGTGEVILMLHGNPTWSFFYRNLAKTFSKNYYIPIGQSFWYKHKERRSEFDQQPEDPASMILALDTAYKVTGNKMYKKYKDICFSWFMGNNSLKLPLYDYKSGGCFDGLHPDRVNLNQGAESLVSYLLSRIAVDN